MANKSYFCDKKKKMRYFVELAYKGTNYHGWQRQPDAISVQEILEKALSTKLQEPVALTGAGRTDTGVHASYFVAHFNSSKEIDTQSIVYGLNNLVGKDIAIYKIFKVEDRLHARFDAISRTYEYRISRIKTPFLGEVSTFFNKDLDIELMNQAGEILLEYIDFTSFSKLHTDTKTNNCKVTKAFWQEKDELLIFTISADRFLRNMVRAIVGTLLEVGENKISLDYFRQIIEEKNRSKAGKSVPAEGLFLTRIEYP